MRILTIALISIVLYSCDKKGKDQAIAQENQKEQYAESSQADTPKINNQKKTEKPESNGFSHTLENQVLVIKEGSTVIYEKPFEGEVQDLSDNVSWGSLYGVYLICNSSKCEDLIVMCEPQQKGALLEIRIPDSVSMYYDDFLSGGVHSRSPSGNLLALDFGTSSDRVLRIYGLKTQKEVARIDYNSVSDIEWGKQDKLTYYGSGHLPDSLLTSGVDDTAKIPNDGESTYTTMLYEKIWVNGETTYTGKYRKIIQE